MLAPQSLGLLVTAVPPFTPLDYLPASVVALVLAALGVALVATVRRKDAE